MKYHVVNIGGLYSKRPPTTEWWQQNLRRGVITAGYSGLPGDNGEKILRHKLSEGDWVIAYANRKGFVGAGLVQGKETYCLHDQIPKESLSDHKHERGILWQIYVDDIHDAVHWKNPQLNPFQFTPTQHTQREIESGLGYRVIKLLHKRASPSCNPVVRALTEAEERIKAAPVQPVDNEHDARVRISTSILQRRGQKNFRDALLKAYNSRCAITGCAVVDVLEAAHIVPHRGQHTNRIDNGLLLRADIHALFDLGRIWIDPTSMTVQVADGLIDSEYTALHGQRLQVPLNANDHPHREHLLRHMQLSTGISIFPEIYPDPDLS